MWVFSPDGDSSSIRTVKMMGVPAFLTPTSRTVLWAISFRAGVDSFDMISNNPLIRIAPMDCAIHDIANIEERERLASDL